MAGQIAVGDVHHLRLTVTDLDRSRRFYTDLLGFDVAVDSPEAQGRSQSVVNKLLWGGIVLTRGNMLLGLRPVAAATDRFDEDRAGLDHLSFSVPGLADLERAVRLFDEQGVPHGQITAMPSFAIYVLSFRDPDNIQLELTAAMT